MVDLERLDEALAQYDAGEAGAHQVFELAVAARAYREYLADPVAAAANLDGAERRSPDYEAAAIAICNDAFDDGADSWELIDDESREMWRREARVAVDAAFPGLFEERP